jgi:transcriptional regulator with XRE-family HTH domain
LSKELPTSDEFFDISDIGVESYRSMIANKLLATRHRLKKQDSSWTKEKMAEYMGLSISTYKRWEKSGSSDVSAIIKINVLANQYPDKKEEAEAEKGLFGEFGHWFDSLVGGFKKTSDVPVDKSDVSVNKSS